LSDQTLVTLGGSYFGSLYRPEHRGSKGGDGASYIGGNGGGFINLQVYKCVQYMTSSIHDTI